MAVVLPFTFATLPATPNPPASDLDANFVALAAAINALAPLTVPRSYLAGCTLSNDAGTPTTILDIAAGQVADSTNVTVINLAAITKSTGGLWAPGSGSAGMGTGLTIASNTWYHVFAILNGGAADVYFDTSITAANKPAGTTAFRRIGSIKTAAGAATIVPFTQFGDKFLWTFDSAGTTNTITPDINGGAFTTSASAQTLASTPLGLQVDAILRGNVTNGAGSVNVSILSPDQNSTVTAASVLQISTSGASAAQGFEVIVRTGSVASPGQVVNVRASAAATTVYATVAGYYDYRGRFN